MAKRQQPRRPAQTSDPDGVMTETPTEVQGDEVLNASNRDSAAEVDDRGPRASASAADEKASGEPTYDDIAALAYELWSRRGGTHGSDFEDWLEAERQLREARRRR